MSNGPSKKKLGIVLKDQYAKYTRPDGITLQIPVKKVWCRKDEEPQILDIAQLQREKEERMTLQELEELTKKTRKYN